MKRKHKETICGIISCLGFLYLMGSVGAMGNNTMTLGQGTLHSIIGLAVFAGAAYIGGFMG